MKKFILICILLVGVCLLLMLLKLSHKASQVEFLQEKNHNQELFIEHLYQTKEYKYVEELQLEIMDLGAQLDSMKIKYD